MMTALYFIGLVVTIPVYLWIVWADNNQITIGDVVLVVLLALIPGLNFLAALSGTMLMLVYYAIKLVKRIERSELMRRRIL